MMLNTYQSSKTPIRVRFAPSPTGEFHVGSARTALYNFLLAQKSEGQLILRVEDTDQARYVAGSMERFFDDLKWLGIEFDEDPIKGGPVGSYIQSERIEYYRDVAQMLLDKDAAYYCFCTPERLEEVRKNQIVRGEQPRYDRHCRDIRDKEIKGLVTPHVIRLKVPETGTIVVDDLIRGRVSFNVATLDDSVLMKSDGFPTYHLAATADDNAMGITYILRGEEWLPSTPKHLLIFQALNWNPPEYAHLPLMLSTDRKKLSKRLHGESVWVRTYREKGYLPEAFINFLALVGWNPGSEREYFSLNELIKTFSLCRVHKAGAIFDTTKLDAFQRHYVQNLSSEELVTRLGDYLKEHKLIKPSEPQFGRLVKIVHDRLGAFGEFPELVKPILSLADYPRANLIFKKSTLESTQKGLSRANDILENVDLEIWHSVERLSETLNEIVKTENLTNGDVFWSVRVALTGQEKSPSPAECLWVLGREESLRRIKVAISKLT